MTSFIREILAIRQDQICVHFLYQTLGIADLRVGHDQFDQQLIDGNLSVSWCRALAECWPRRFAVLKTVVQPFKFTALDHETLGYPMLEWRSGGGQSSSVGFLSAKPHNITVESDVRIGLKPNFLAPREAHRIGLREIWYVERPFSASQLSIEEVFSN